MRFLRLIPLLALPLLFLGATCVSRVEQRGPAGPWVGEVSNYGPEAVEYASVSAEILDAMGNSITWLEGSTCPPTLRPGQHGTFELLFPLTSHRRRSCRFRPGSTRSSMACRRLMF